MKGDIAVLDADPREIESQLFLNGQREDNNNYQIEGITASDYNVAELTNTPLPSPDVVQEFKVQTSLYDATQGRNGGGRDLNHRDTEAQRREDKKRGGQEEKRDARLPNGRMVARLLLVL